MLNSIAASTVTALFTTFCTYPLDLAHGRMAADMSKKPSIVIDRESQKAQKIKLYSSVRDCLTKTQQDSGLGSKKQLSNVYKGLPSALIS